MSKVPITPLTSDFIAVKGNAAPVAAKPREEPSLKIVEAAPESRSKKPAAPAPAELIVSHNFRVKKSFKRAFDKAAFDEDMNGVTFLQHIFTFYDEHRKRG